MRVGKGILPHPMFTSTPASPLPCLLLFYPTLLGYVRLGKVERYVGVVLGKNRFNKDIPLCYHEISLQFIQL